MSRWSWISPAGSQPDYAFKFEHSRHWRQAAWGPKSASSPTIRSQRSAPGPEATIRGAETLCCLRSFGRLVIVRSRPEMLEVYMDVRKAPHGRRFRIWKASGLERWVHAKCDGRVNFRGMWR